MEKIRIGENEFVYRSKYHGLFTKNDFLYRFAQNKKISTIPDDNSIWIEFECSEFKSIDSFIIDLIEREIVGSQFNYYAKHSWVYTQKKGSDYTFTFYVQQPSNLTEDEGKIVFKTKDGNIHKFLPQEMDLFIFPADMYHTAVPTPKNDELRVVYAGNIAYNFLDKSPKNLNLI